MNWFFFVWFIYNLSDRRFQWNNLFTLFSIRIDEKSPSVLQRLSCLALVAVDLCKNYSLAYNHFQFKCKLKLNRKKKKKKYISIHSKSLHRKLIDLLKSVLINPFFIYLMPLRNRFVLLILDEWNWPINFEHFQWKII